MLKFCTVAFSWCWPSLCGLKSTTFYIWTDQYLEHVESGNVLVFAMKELTATVTTFEQDLET